MNKRSLWLLCVLNKQLYKHFFRTMKIATILLFVFSFCLLAENTHSQNVLVSINQKNVQLEDVLEEIERQTDYLFIYNKHVNVNRNVSLQETNVPLKNVLDNLFDETNVSYAVEGSYIVLSVDEKSKVSGLAQQKRSVTGVITDASGEPIIGANVIEKGNPSNGVITDFDGRFSLAVHPESKVLVISYIGYITQEVALRDVSNYTIVLEEDTQALNEVVVIGYGTVKKSDLTGAVGSIQIDKVQGVSIKSVDQMLQGRTSGLYMVQNSGMPGASSSVRIRGGNSISGGNEPLYIIDGVPVYPSGGSSHTELNPLNTIPTNDIESIEVLKDASSTAIYGSRGANGVIIVTTKRGQSGKTNVSFESYWGVENIAKDFNLLDAATFEKLSNESLVNSGGKPAYDESSPSPTTDWQELTKNKNALLQNYQLTVSGGNEKSTFLTSFNIYDQKGTIRATDMKKFAFRANLEHKISATMRMGVNLTLTKVDNNRVGNSVLGSRLTTPPNLPVKQNDGSYTYSDDAGVTTFDNPVGVINDKVDKTSRFRTLDNAFIEWNILKGLTLKSSVGIDLNYSKSDYYNPRSIYSGSLKDGEAIKQAYNTLIWINENILTYTNSWDKHSFTGMLGYTQQASDYDKLSAGSYGFQNDILEMNNLGAGTTYSTPGSTLEKWALNSYLGRINYSYNSKYLLTASFRADGSSRFGSNNRWGYFPSVALAWRASEESFIKEWEFISNLKPRISYGVTGNQDGIGVYPSYALLGTTGFPVGGSKETGYYPSQVANAKLKWETTTQYDAGLDIGFLNNRLNFVIDAYYKKTSDLLLRVTVPATSGFTTGLKNIGEVENKGIEMAINATPVTGEFTWNTNFNITFNRNKVLDLGDVSFIYPTAGQENNGIHLGRIIKVGEPLGTFYGYAFDGIFGTTDDIVSSAQPNAKPGDIRFKDISGPDGVPDGMINDLDRTIIGCAQPKFFGGFVNDFSYKNFDLNVNMIFTYGNDIYNGTRVTMEDMQGATNMFASTINRWTPENQNTNLPRMLRSKTVMRVSDQYVEKGSYLRIQNITLGYAVPKQVLKYTKHVSGLRVYASLQNFFTITNYSGNNPEVSKYGQDNLGAGYDSFTYPMSKTVLFGLNVNF